MASLIDDAIDKARKQACLFQKNATKCHGKSHAGNRKLSPQVSLNLNLKKPLPTAAFQEKIEDVTHLLDDEQSILAAPTNTLTIHFGDIF